MALKMVELLNHKNSDTYGDRPATIGFLGDSVTKGCFEVLPAMTGHGEDGCNVIYLNHPSRQIHWPFATSLAETFFHS